MHRPLGHPPSRSLIGILLFASCCGTKGTETWVVTAREAVAIHTKSHADVELDLETDGEHVRAFLDRPEVTEAETRQAVVDAWRDSAALSGKAPELPRRAFEAAEADASWPEGRTVSDAVYVEGLREGLETFLMGG